MTHAERDVLARAASSLGGVPLTFAPCVESGFVRLQTPNGVCPLFTRMEGQGTCTVHEVRPYNCRRWGCYRTDYTQPPDMRPIPVHALSNRDLRRQYARAQAKAQVWADAHGWSA